MKETKNCKTAIFLFFILVCFLGCRRLYIEGPNRQFSALINRKLTNKHTNHILRFDGAYHHIDSSSYHHGTDYKNGIPTRYVDTPYLDKPLIFFENGLMALNLSLYLNDTIFAQSMERFGTQKSSFLNDWGVYQIVGDTIKAIIYKSLTGDPFSQAGAIRYQFGFEGILVNSDTILQWQMIGPYSDVFGRGNDYEYKVLSTPRDLYFKKAPIKELINPDNAWINDFKEDSVHKKRRK
jgi:hypothetical protein